MTHGSFLYYAVGPVHPRQAALLRGHLPGWTMRLAYEASLPWFRGWRPPQGIDEAVAIRGPWLPRRLWAGPVRALILATAQPRETPIRLIEQAMRRGIPTVGIEETHQMALSCGRVNNYVLPLDHLLAASTFERDALIASGAPAARVEASGWPFATAGTEPVRPSDAATMKRRLGLRTGGRAAVLILSGLHDSGEDWESRRHQLTIVERGLPAGYELLVRPHPTEPLPACRAVVSECAPRARILEGRVPIEDVLQATEVVINRGASQVCVEALLCGRPVVIIDAGHRTPFHDMTPELIVREPSDLTRVIAGLEAPDAFERAYAAFRAAHLVPSPAAARQAVCARLTEIAAADAPAAAGRGRQWFDLALFAAWRGRRRAALAMCRRAAGAPGTLPIDSLRRLIDRRAGRDDLAAVRATVGAGTPSQVLPGLWITQLDRRRQVPSADDLAWLEEFPPAVNTAWFADDAARWARVLLRHRSNAAGPFGGRLAREFGWHPGLRRVAKRLAERVA